MSEKTGTVKASKLVEMLQAAIREHGDLDIFVAYDGAHAEIQEGEGPSDGFGPRGLNVVMRDMPGYALDGTKDPVFEL